MKVEDFAYQVAMRTIELLEQKYHYKIAEETQKDVCALILKDVNDIIRKSS